jgi:phytoene dehydrogenase-like protein
MGRAASSADAVVIGAGHNGLVAAAMLADAGWDVVVLEAQNEAGGAVKSAELTPGYTHDLYSAFGRITRVADAQPGRLRPALEPCGRRRRSSAIRG